MGLTAECYFKNSEAEFSFRIRGFRIQHFYKNLFGKKGNLFLAILTNMCQSDFATDHCYRSISRSIMRQNDAVTNFYSKKFLLMQKKAYL
jgi:hypothetical protein